MSKPIFIIRIPYRGFDGEYDPITKLRNQIQDELTDYHVLITTDGTSNKSEFECYNADDATKTNIQELQDKIFEILKQNETL
jgi:hypothetical protein